MSDLFLIYEYLRYVEVKSVIIIYCTLKFTEILKIQVMTWQRQLFQIRIQNGWVTSFRSGFSEGFPMILHGHHFFFFTRWYSGWWFQTWYSNISYRTTKISDNIYQIEYKKYVNFIYGMSSFPIDA